jgi:hypothetical protein
MLLPEPGFVTLILETAFQGVGVVKSLEKASGGFPAVIEILAGGVAAAVGMIADIVMNNDIVKLPSEITPV